MFAVAIVVVLLLILIYSSAIPSCDGAIADWLFGAPEVVCDEMHIYHRDGTKLVMHNFKCSMPVRLYLTLDPIDAEDIVLSKQAIHDRLARMCSDSICFNFANFVFAIKDRNLLGALAKANTLKALSIGEIPNPAGSGLAAVLDFKTRFMKS